MRGGESPAEFEDWLEAQIRATHAAAAQDDAPKRKSAKAGKREAQREQVAEGGTRAVREAYRRLVSELHPDRETDPDAQTRKTELMQRVNQAYKAGDLLGLLEMQLSLEQIDAAALAGLADERLRHYVHVLEEQGRQLRDELQELVEPFAVVLGESSMRKVTTDAVQRRLDKDIRDTEDHAAPGRNGRHLLPGHPAAEAEPRPVSHRSVGRRGFGHAGRLRSVRACAGDAPRRCAAEFVPRPADAPPPLRHGRVADPSGPSGSGRPASPAGNPAAQPNW